MAEIIPPVLLIVLTHQLQELVLEHPLDEVASLPSVAIHRIPEIAEGYWPCGSSHDFQHARGVDEVGHVGEEGIGASLV